MNIIDNNIDYILMKLRDNGQPINSVTTERPGVEALIRYYQGIE